MSYQIYTPAGIYRTGLGQGGRAKLKLYGRKTGKRRGYTTRMVNKLRQRYGITKSRIPRRNFELKFFDTALSIPFDLTGECSTSGATGNIHIIAQGDGDNNRDGRQITIKSIQFRGTVLFTPGGSATATTTCYLYVMLDTQCNGANPAITDVFTSNDMGSNFLNLSNDGRFRIIKKFVWTFTSTAGVTTAYNAISYAVEWYQSCDILITYDSSVTTGSIASTKSNSIFCAFGSDGNSDDGVTFDGASRVRFVG